MNRPSMKHRRGTDRPWQVSDSPLRVSPRRDDPKRIPTAARAVQCLVACALLALATPAFAADSPDQQKLRDALQEIERLRGRLGELEGVVRELSGAKPDAKPTHAEKMKQPVKWNELMMGSSMIRFYGFARLDMIYSDSRQNNSQLPAFVRSEDPTAPVAIGSPANSDLFTMHPRLTRFGADFIGPNIERLGNAKVTGKLEIDFYGGGSESRANPRMRHAWVKLAWDDFSILGGQTSDVISPIFPVVNPDFVMWGAGNLGDRRPQLRPEWTPKFGEGRFIVQGEVGLTGADDAQDLDPAANGGFRDGEASGMPTLQGRIAYRHPLWEKKANVEVGVWAHYARENTDTPQGASGRQGFRSEAVGFDMTVPLYKDLLWAKGELWKGTNLTDVRGGILQGINTVTGQEVRSEGGWFELGAKPAKWFTLHGGFSFDDPRDTDLAAGARAKNEIWYFALRGLFDPVEIGFDYLNWTTKYIGFRKGDDNRVQAYIMYKF